MALSRLQRAVLFAAAAHAGDDREGFAPLPYVTHPIEVLNNLRYIGGVTDEDMLCAAVLHDVVEESPTKLADIGNEFGQRVQNLVSELTRREPGRDETAKLTKDEIWKLRAAMLVREISRMSSDAQCIKLADRLANVREAKRSKKGRKLKRYLSQTKKILQAVDKSVNKPLWKAIKKELLDC